MLPDALFPGKDSKLPPRLETLLAWSRLFRSGRTFRNYLGYVRTACLVTKQSVVVRVCGVRLCDPTSAFDVITGVRRPRLEEGEEHS